jgi:hypothetical protein
MGAQNSLLKSVIAPLLSRDVRATGFGLFDAGFGVAWFRCRSFLEWFPRPSAINLLSRFDINL